MVNFEVCFGSLSCWNTQTLFNFKVWTDLYVDNISCAPSCHTTPKHNGSTSTLTVVLLQMFLLWHSPQINPHDSYAENVILNEPLGDL